MRADSVIHALIVDDEPPARENVRVLLGRARDVDVVAECGSGSRAVQAIYDLDPDLVFLDIQMPEMDGFQVIESVGPERMPVTIFVTAYDRYALRAFDAGALDYLLKPFDDTRFAEALERARAHIRNHSQGELARRMLTLLEVRRAAGGSTGWLRHMKAQGRDGVLVIKVADIHHFEAAGDYVRAHTSMGVHVVDATMKFLEARLDPAQFVRVHRSHIVNVDRIRELQPFVHGDCVVVLEDGTRVRLSRGRRAELDRVLGGSRDA